MSNSMKAMRVVRGISQSLCIVLLLLACGALSAQNHFHHLIRVQGNSHSKGRGPTRGERQ